MKTGTKPTKREAAIANAADLAQVIPGTADDWFKVSPYGTFPGRVPSRPQHFGREDAENVLAEFNSVRGRLGRMFRGVPVYRGHPDVDPTIWTDDRRLGKVTDLEVRDDGLWARAEWNSLGRENLEEGWWLYPSPRWDAPAGRPKFAPDRLISIGLTNTPRIDESEPIANSEDLTAGEADDETETDELMDPKLIREKLGLPPEATDDEVMAKLASLMETEATAETATAEAETAKTEKAEMETAKTAAEAEAQAARDEANNSMLDLAVAQGRIVKADVPAWKAKLEGDKRDEVVNSLQALKPKLNTTGLAGGQTREDVENADLLREHVANARAELMDKQGLSFHEAHCRVKKDKRFAAYFGG
jgi:hypothetical protein